MKYLKLLVLLSSAIYANEADVLGVEHNCNQDRVCSFSVTIKHNNTGWSQNTIRHRYCHSPRS